MDVSSYDGISRGMSFVFLINQRVYTVMSHYPVSVIHYLKILLNLAQTHRMSGESFVSQCKSWKIDGILWGAVESGWIQSTDLGISESEVVLSLKKYKLQQTAKVLYWFASLKKVLEAIGDIPSILLKGLPLSEMWYGSCLWRDTSDIDLWVPCHLRAEALKRLKDVGYSVTVEPHLWATNQILLECSNSVPVEIHWRMTQPPLRTPSFNHAFKRSEIYTYQDIAVPVLSDADMYIQLMSHALMHEFEPRTQLDLCACFDCFKPDIDLLKAFGLYRYYGALERFVWAYKEHDEITKDCILNHHLYRAFSDRLLNRFFKFSNHRDTNLMLFGSDAVCGQAKRALLMLLLDDDIDRLRAFVSVIFFGPHPLGARFASFFR